MPVRQLDVNAGFITLPAHGRTVPRGHAAPRNMTTRNRLVSPETNVEHVNDTFAHDGEQCQRRFADDRAGLRDGPLSFSAPPSRRRLVVPHLSHCDVGKVAVGGCQHTQYATGGHQTVAHDIWFTAGRHEVNRQHEALLSPYMGEPQERVTELQSKKLKCGISDRDRNRARKSTVPHVDFSRYSGADLPSLLSLPPNRISKDACRRESGAVAQMTVSASDRRKMVEVKDHD